MAPKNKTKTKTKTKTLPPAETKTLAATQTETLPVTQTETLPATQTETLPPAETKTLPPTKTKTLTPTKTKTLPPTQTETLPPTKAKNLALAKIKTLVPTKSSSSSEEDEEPKTPVKTPSTDESSSDDTGSSSSGIKQPKNLKVSSKTPERKASCSRGFNVGVEKQVVLEEKEEPDNRKNDSTGKKDKKVSKSHQKPESTKIAESEKSDSEDSDVKKEVTKKGKIDTRVWSEEDEIKVLEWVIRCKTEGTPPTSDKEGFNNFMGKIYEKRQLSDKIYKLKKKFLKFVGSWEKAGFDSLYENSFYSLGKQIWKSEMMNTGTSDKKGKQPKEVEDEKAKRVSSIVKMGKRKVMDSGEKEGDSKRAKLEIAEDEFWNKYPLLRESIQTYSSLLFGKEKMISVFHHGTKLGDKWAQDMESQWSLYAEKEKEMKSLELEIFMDGIKEEMEIDIEETN